MYPVTHVCVANRIFKYDDGRTRVGSILPDALTSIMLWGDSHSFYSHDALKEKYVGTDKEWFYLDILTHGIKPRGIDYYCDVSWRGKLSGYAYQKAEPLVDDVAKACGIELEAAIWKSHNFIEMATELFIVNNHLNIARDMRNLSKQDEDIIRYNTLDIDKFFNYKEGATASCLLRFIDRIIHLEYSENAMLEQFARGIKYQFDKNMDMALGAEVLKKSIKIIEDDILEFFDHIVLYIEKNIKDFIGEQ